MSDTPIPTTEETGAEQFWVPELNMWVGPDGTPLENQPPPPDDDFFANSADAIARRLQEENGGALEDYVPLAQKVADWQQRANTPWLPGQGPGGNSLHVNPELSSISSVARSLGQRPGRLDLEEARDLLRQVMGPVQASGDPAASAAAFEGASLAPNQLLGTFDQDGLTSPGFYQTDFRLGDLDDQRGIYASQGIFTGGHPMPDMEGERQSRISERLSLGLEDITVSEARALIGSLEGDDLWHFQISMHEAGLYSGDPVFGLITDADFGALEGLIRLNILNPNKDVATLLEEGRINQYGSRRESVTSRALEDASAADTQRFAIRSEDTIGRDVDAAFEAVMGRAARTIPKERRDEVVAAMRRREQAYYTGLYEQTNPDDPNSMAPRSEKVQAILDAIGVHESNNDYEAFNADGNAHGRYQITGDTWREWSQKVFGTQVAMSAENQEIVATEMVEYYLDIFNGDVRMVMGAWYSGPNGLRDRMETGGDLRQTGKLTGNQYPTINEYADRGMFTYNELITANDRFATRDEFDAHNNLRGFTGHRPIPDSYFGQEALNRTGPEFYDAFDYQGQLDASVRDIDPARAEAYEYANMARQFYTLLGRTA